MMDNIISYESNVMLAAILCLLLVILFVLLLHIYARWFLAEAQQRQTRATLSVARVLGQVRLGQEHPATTYAYDINTQTTKGLDLAEIDTIPLFVYGPDGREPALECAICLSVFEGREVGRSLPRCSHAFHVECIDMWLHSHSTCPICRAQVLEVDVDGSTQKDGVVINQVTYENVEDSRSLAEILVGINEDFPSDNESDRSSSVNSSVHFTVLECSLSRMLARSRSENRVHPSLVGTQVEVELVLAVSNNDCWL